MQLKENYSLLNLNTFGLDVKTKKFLSINSVNEIKEYLNCEKIEIGKTLVLGSGSNILFQNNYDGLVLKSNIMGIHELEKNDDSVILEVGSGVIWDELVTYAVERNYGGIENLSLIPGTVGAAPIQNIGAYGVEFEEVFVSLDAINLITNELKTFKKEECEFDYRDSIFKRKLKNKYLITKVVVKLSLSPILNVSYRAIREYLQENDCKTLNVKSVSEIVKQIRNSKLPNPSKIGNAGSFFKNPIIDQNVFDVLKSKYEDLVFYKIGPNQYKIPAGWLIEKTGLKGKRIGNVGVHNKQALVLVNHGNANGSELVNLAEEIKTRIYDKFNINLKTEVNIV